MGEKTSTGLQQNIAGILCYLIGWITGLVFIILEKDNRFVRFHAMQSIFVFGAFTILSIVLTSLIGITGITGPIGAFGMLLRSIHRLIQILGLLLWILLMVKAYNNEYYKLPFFGEMAEEQLRK